MSKQAKGFWIALAVAVAVIGAFALLGGGKRAGQPPAPTAEPLPPDAVQAAEPDKKQTPAPTHKPAKPGEFELPIEGATGFTTVEANLREKPSPDAVLLKKIAPGTAFRVLQEMGEYWKVESDEFSGYLAHKYLMINLPDVIPSIVYENTNASKSRVHSSGKAVPGVTGQKLYASRAYDERLGREEFIMPALYQMAKKICAAQQQALADGNCLKIYEAYRPASAQRMMVQALNDFAARDEKVMRGISTAPWKVSWFVSQGTSNHQRGLAIDVSLIKADELKREFSGDRAFTRVTKYTEYEMPTPIHELSIAAAAFSYPVTSTSQTAWESAAPAASMNEEALLLQRYMADARLTPLASEWWHFNDLGSFEALGGNLGSGEQVLKTLYSVSPPSAG